MTKTLISSDKQEVTIGFDAPFCVIGERINPTGRKILSEEIDQTLGQMGCPDFNDLGPDWLWNGADGVPGGLHGGELSGEVGHRTAAE